MKRRTPTYDEIHEPGFDPGPDEDDMDGLFEDDEDDGPAIHPEDRGEDWHEDDSIGPVY